MIQSYDLLSYYFDFVEDQSKDLKNLKNALKDGSQTDVLLVKLAEDYDETSRIEAERFYYSSYSQNQYVVNKNKILESLENEINDKSKLDMPKFVFDIFEKIDEKYSLP